WGDIAVIVRGGGEIGQVRRTLLAAGVPVHISPTDVVLSEQRLVSAVLQAVRALTDPLDNVGLEELITGPVGGADPVTLRRLIRGLRRWRPTVRGIDSLREVLDGELPDFGGLLTGREQAILERVRGVLDAGRAALDGSIEDVLWAVWSATGLSDRLQAAALRGGATGSQADRDLDAMMALFDAAGDYAERYPHAPLESFLISIEEQELPTGVRDRRSATPQAVEVLSAHGAVGREWDTVVVVGAQEGTWPSLGETGSLFGQEDLIDYLDEGIEPDVPVSHLAARLQEERRLFHVATSRHRARLLIAAIDAPEGDEVFEPSRFIAEFAGQGLDLPGRLARREANERLRRTAVA
ncbi:3'-5' exonuclease, partial [Corynebacterium phoceense]